MSDLRIVACGGGNPTGSALPHFTTALDLTGTPSPNLLIIPSAKTTQANHDSICAKFEQYGAERGYKVRVLHKFKELPPLATAIELLQWADIVYVAGGDTEQAIQTWQSWKNEANLTFATIFTEMVRAGAFVVFGISAGLLAWFGEGFSDSDSYRVPIGEAWDYRPVRCLGLLHECLADVHHDQLHPLSSMQRSALFQRELASRVLGALGLGVENGAALRILGRGTQQVTVDFLGAPEAGGQLVHRYINLGYDNGLDAVTFDPGVGTMVLTDLLT